MLQLWSCLLAALLMAVSSSGSRFYHIPGRAFYVHPLDHDLYHYAHRRMARAVGAAEENDVPMSLEKLKDLKTDTPKILSFGAGCNLMLQGVLSITVLSVQKCKNGPPSLRAMLEYFKVNDLGQLSDIIEPEQYEFTQLDIQNKNDAVSFKGKSKQTIEFLDGKLVMKSGAELQLLFPQLMGGFPLDKAAAKINGITELLNGKGKLSIIMAEKDPYFAFEIKPPSMGISDWVHHFDMKLKDLVDYDVKFHIERLGKIVIKNPVIRGEATKHAFQLLCLGTVEQEPLLKGADILAVASREKGKLPKVAFLIKTKGDNDIVDILSKYTSEAKYLSKDLKIVKELDLKLLLTISQAPIHKVRSVDLKPMWEQVALKGEAKQDWVLKGIHIKTKTKLPKKFIKQNKSTGTRRDEVTDAIIADLQVKADGLAMEFGEQLQAEAIDMFFEALPDYIKDFIAKILEVRDAVNEYVEIKEFQIGDLPSGRKLEKSAAVKETTKQQSRVRRDLAKGSQASLEDSLYNAMEQAINIQAQEEAVKRSVMAKPESGNVTAATKPISVTKAITATNPTTAAKPTNVKSASSETRRRTASASSSPNANDESGENEAEEPEEEEAKASILHIEVKKRIQLLEGVDLFSVPEMEVYIKYLGGNWTFSAEAKFQFETQTVPVMVGYEDGVYTFKISFDRLSLADIVRVVVSSSYINPASFIPGLDEIGIKNFQFVGKFGDTFRLRIAGTPFFFGFEHVHLEGYIWEKSDKSKSMAFGLVVDEVRLDELMESIFGHPVLPASFFSQVTGFLVISDSKASGEQRVDEGNSGSGSSGSSSGSSSGNDNGRRLAKTNQLAAKGTKQTARSGLISKVLRSGKGLQSNANAGKPGAVVRARSEYGAGGNREGRYRPAGKRNVKGERKRRRILGRNQMRRHHKKRGSLKKRGSSGSKKRTSSSSGSSEVTASDVPASHGNAENTPEEEGEEEEEEEEEEEVDDDMKFTLQELVGKDIDKGVQFEAKFSPPQQESECEGDNLCKFMHEKMNPDDYVLLAGSFSPGEFELKAEINMERNLTDNFRFIAVSLELKYAGKDSSITLACRLGYDNGDDIDLVFEGSISAKVTGEVFLRFTMTGNWEKPFGFPYLIIKKVLLGIGYTPGAPLPSLEFGADIYVGDVDAVAQADLIHLVGYFGFDPVNPSNNFVYASASGLTVGGVIAAFNMGIDLPQFISDTGFPGEVTFSFSASGKEIESIGLEVEQGVYFKGTFNFLGYEVRAEINIVLKDPADISSGGWPFEKFLIDIEMSPFTMSSGLIALQRSSSDSTKGPKAYINFEQGSVPNADIQGYVTVLGMSAETNIQLSDTEFRFFIAGTVYGIFHSSLSVNASYGSLSEMNFEFEGCISIDATQIAQIVKDLLNQASDAAKAAKAKAKEKLDDARGFLDQARLGLDRWNQSIIGHRNLLIERCKALEEKKRKLEQQRCQDECGKVCIPFLTWKSKCWKLWWWWVGCPWWDNCRWEVDDPICMAGCEIKKAINKMALWAEKLGIKIMIGFTHFGEALIGAGQTFLTGAEKLVDLAEAVVDAVEAIVQVGLRIAEAIVSFTLESIVIKKFCIGGRLNSNFDACVDVTFNATFFGADVNYYGKKCINLNFFKSVGSGAVEQEYPGVQKMKEDLEEVDGQFAEIEESQSDLNKEEGRIDSDVRAEIASTRRSNIPRRLSAMTKEDAWIHRVADMTVPQISLKREDVIHKFEASSLANLVKDYDLKQMTGFAATRDNIESPADLFKEEPGTGACHEVKAVINKYSQFHGGLQSLSQSLAYQKRMFTTSRDAMRRSVQTIEDNIKDSLNKYNATREDKEAMHFWRDKAKNDVESWIKATTNALRAQRRSAIGNFRSQLDSVFQEHKKTDVTTYIQQLHDNAANAIKRGTLPSAESTEAENSLLLIKRSLVEILGEKGVKTKGFESVVTNLSGHIEKARSLLDKC